MGPGSAPVAESQRIGLLDFLRGIAILGILTVNIFSFGLPQLGYYAPYAWGEVGPSDAIAFSASVFIFQQKMYPLLAFLFGVGIYLLCEKEERTGRRSTGVFLRRMGILAGIGLLHAILLWHGDILVWYSLAGLLAYLMRNLSTKLLLIIGIGMTWGMSVFCCSPLVGAMALFPEESMPQLEAFREHPATMADAAEFVDKPYWDNFVFIASNFLQNPQATALEAHYYANGSWLEVAPLRVFIWVNTAMSAVMMMIPLLTGIMLLGILAGRAGLLVGEAIPRRALWTTVGLGLLVGLPLCAVGLWLIWIKYPAAMYGSMMLNMIGGPLLAGLYVVILTGFYRSALGQLFAFPIECVGRMAMSNYIGQTIVFVILFHGWAVGWHGQLSYSGLGLLVVLSWVVQAALSVIWLRFFRFGPLEWLWRSATYWRIQPLLRGGEA